MSSFNRVSNITGAQLNQADRILQGSDLEGVTLLPDPPQTSHVLGLGGGLRLEHYERASYTGAQLRAADKILEGSELEKTLHRRGGKPFLDI